jgi:hypothetical protein
MEELVVEARRQLNIISNTMCSFSSGEVYITLILYIGAENIFSSALTSPQHKSAQKIDNTVITPYMGIKSRRKKTRYTKGERAVRNQE